MSGCYGRVKWFKLAVLGLDTIPQRLPQSRSRIFRESDKAGTGARLYLWCSTDEPTVYRISQFQHYWPKVLVGGPIKPGSNTRQLSVVRSKPYCHGARLTSCVSRSIFALDPWAFSHSARQDALELLWAIWASNGGPLSDWQGLEPEALTEPE